MAVATGELNAQEAFIEGRIRLTGDQQKLIDSQPVFGALDGVFTTVRAQTEYRIRRTSRARAARGAGPRRAADRRSSPAPSWRGSSPLTFTALKTAVPAPDGGLRPPARATSAGGASTCCCEFEPVTFVVHLMQGGRLLVDEKQSAKPRGGQARFVFERRPGAAADRGRHRAARRRVVRARRRASSTGPPLDRARPGGLEVDAEELAAPLRRRTTCGCHGSCATSTASPGSAAVLANEVCHRAKLSPFAMTGKLGADGADEGRRRHPRGGRRGPGLRAHPPRHELVGRPSRPGAQPRRRALPGVRRHHPQVSTAATP